MPPPSLSLPHLHYHRTTVHLHHPHHQNEYMWEAGSMNFPWPRVPRRQQLLENNYAWNGKAWLLCGDKQNSNVPLFRLNGAALCRFKYEAEDILMFFSEKVRIHINIRHIQPHLGAAKGGCSELSWRVLGPFYYQHQKIVLGPIF